MVWSNFKKFGCANDQGNDDGWKYVKEKCVAKVVPTGCIVVVFYWMAAITLNKYFIVNTSQP